MLQHISVFALATLAALLPGWGASAQEAASVAAAPAPVEAKSGATAVVNRLHDALIGVMRDAAKLGYRGRYDRLAPVLQECFDLPFMAEKSVGRYWDDASPEEQKSLVDTFGRYTIANYAGRFDSYSGQSFESLAEEPSTHGTVLVRTRLMGPSTEEVHLDYRLRFEGASWRIIDVYFNGTVSELALRRSEYSSLIKREGFKALLAALDKRIADLAAAAPPAGSAS
jgi:phospholipid transport system substrate-binding protein